MVHNKNDNGAGAGVQKHRACDECRARKLACSKEPDGCARCKREGIACFYSPQKPMGRPRKRRHAEDETAPRAHAAPRRASKSAPSFPEVAGDLGTFASSQPLVNYVDPSLGFLEHPPSPSLAFFSSLSDFPQGDPLTIPDISMTDPLLSTSQVEQFHSLGLPASISDYDIQQSLLFDTPSRLSWEDPDTHPPSLSVSSHFSESPEAPASPPSEASHSSVEQTLQQFGQPRKAAPSVVCGCLSSLYFALESLSHLPREVSSAMRVTRGATKVAHDTMCCQTCSGLVRDIGDEIPMQSYQNLMLLGALVPSACNAYASILEMVHEEVMCAKQENRRIRFSFREVGGQWNSTFDDEPSDCFNLHSYDEQYLEPDVWREVICSILRLDVYGDEEGTICRHGGPVTSRGLGEIVTILDEKTSARHDEMDRLALAGQLPKHRNDMLLCPSSQYQPTAKEDRHCVRVMHLARVALDNLVIA